MTEGEGIKSFTPLCSVQDDGKEEEKEEREKRERRKERKRL